MKPVTNYYQEPRLWHGSKATLRTISEPASKNELSQAASSKDQVDLTETASDDLQVRTQKLLEQLTKNFPGLSFEAVPDKEFSNLKEKAASLGPGKHLVISEAFLARMGSSEKDFQACKTMLLSSVLLLGEKHAAGVFLGEKQAVSFNIKEKDTAKDSETETLSKMLENLKQAGKNASNQNYKVPSNVSYATGELYRKLARAGDKALIQSVVSETYQNMGSLRLISCMGDDKERAKAQKAIRSLEKLIVRSRQKLRQLDKEELLKLKRQRAVKRQEEAKIREVQQELKKAQTKRMRLDKKLLEEGDAADQEIRRLKQYLAQANSTRLLSPASIEAGAPAELSSGDAACVSAEQIELSEPVAF